MGAWKSLLCTLTILGMNMIKVHKYRRYLGKNDPFYLQTKKLYPLVLYYKMEKKKMLYSKMETTEKKHGVMHI